MPSHSRHTSCIADTWTDWDADARATCPTMRSIPSRAMSP